MPKPSYIKAVEELSKSIQKAIDHCPPAQTLSEDAYCDAVLEAMDGIAEGLKMHKQELEEESEGDE